MRVTTGAPPISIQPAHRPAPPRVSRQRDRARGGRASDTIQGLTAIPWDNGSTSGSMRRRGNAAPYTGGFPAGGHLRGIQGSSAAGGRAEGPPGVRAGGGVRCRRVGSRRGDRAGRALRREGSRADREGAGDMRTVTAGPGAWGSAHRPASARALLRPSLPDCPRGIGRRGHIWRPQLHAGRCVQSGHDAGCPRKGCTHAADDQDGLRRLSSLRQHRPRSASRAGRDSHHIPMGRWPAENLGRIRAWRRAGVRRQTGDAWLHPGIRGT